MTKLTSASISLVDISSMHNITDSHLNTFIARFELFNFINSAEINIFDNICEKSMYILLDEVRLICGLISKSL